MKKTSLCIYMEKGDELKQFFKETKSEQQELRDQMERKEKLIQAIINSPVEIGREHNSFYTNDYSAAQRYRATSRSIQDKDITYRYAREVCHYLEFYMDLPISKTETIQIQVSPPSEEEIRNRAFKVVSHYEDHEGKTSHVSYRFEESLEHLATTGLPIRMLDEIQQGIEGAKLFL